MFTYFVFLFFIISWLIVVFSLPILQGLHLLSPEKAKIFYLAFKILCHQKSERSYFIFNYQMPVCVRCLGIYLGLFGGTLIYPIFKKINNTKLPPIFYFLFFFAPIWIDGISQIFNLYSSPHYLRFATGFIAGFIVPFYFLPVLVKIKESYW